MKKKLYSENSLENHYYKALKSNKKNRGRKNMDGDSNNYHNCYQYHHMILQITFLAL